MAIIGKNVIENLTTAMYEDLKIIYREYIQNSADSIDHAVKEKIIEARDARIEINIEANNLFEKLDFETNIIYDNDLSLIM